MAESKPFASNYPIGIEAIARDTNPQVLSWILNEWQHLPINLVWADFCDDNLTKTCLARNGIPVNWAGNIPRPTKWKEWKTIDQQTVEWFEQAGVDIEKWTQNAVKDVGAWIDETINGARVEAPRKGTRLATLPNGVAEFQIRLNQFVCTDSPDISEGNELEVYGQVFAKLTGRIGTARDANQYLWNSRPGDRFSISEEADHNNHSKRVQIVKYLYAHRNDLSACQVTIVMNLYERDTDSANDPFTRTSHTFRLADAPTGTWLGKRVHLTADGDEKIRVDLQIQRLR